MHPTHAVTMIGKYAAAGVAGLRASYPVPPQINPPHLILYWDEAEIVPGGGSYQYWTMTVYGQLLVGALGVPEREVLRAEQIVTPLVDVFSPDNVGDAAYHLEDLTANNGQGDRVDRCFLARSKASREIFVAASGYYGAELWWEVNLRREAGSS